jgi:hypothetical protein
MVNGVDFLSHLRPFEALSAADAGGSEIMSAGKFRGKRGDGVRQSGDGGFRIRRGYTESRLIIHNHAWSTPVEADDRDSEGEGFEAGLAKGFVYRRVNQAVALGNRIVNVIQGWEAAFEANVICDTEL